jgi:hypothetical protein
MKNLILLCCVLTSFAASAQESPLYEIRRKWYLPDHVKLQFAGNIGFMSGGPGWVSRNKTLETDILFGFLPRKYGGDALITLTSKITYSPWRIATGNNTYIRPFSLGFYMSHTFGPQFDSSWPEYYPKGYYWWATAVRPGAYVGGKIGNVLPKKMKSLELYYEVGTYDLLAISYVKNTRFLKPGDIVSLALGIKVGF